MRGVGWDASHGEFLVEDYYYLSKLGKLLRERGIKVNQVEDFDELEEYDVIVFNYPEEEFEKKEVERIEKWLSKGKRNVEIGKNISITTDQYGLIIDYHIMENETDSQIVISTKNRVLALHKVYSWSFDKGFWKKTN
ncbi:hypothetical protein DRN89_02480, partial [archaeon]